MQGFIMTTVPLGEESGVWPVTEIYEDSAWREREGGERLAVSRSLPGGHVDRGVLASGLAG